MDRGSEIHKRKYCSNLNCICKCFQLIYTRTYLLGSSWEWIYLDQSFWLLFDYLSNLFYPLSNSLGPSSPTHFLQIYCAGLTGPISLYILGLGFKTCPYSGFAKSYVAELAIDVVSVLILSKIFLNFHKKY